jgi:hypothetical protein
MPETPDAIEEVGEGGPSGLVDGPESVVDAMSMGRPTPPGAVGSRPSH